MGDVGRGIDGEVGDKGEEGFIGDIGEKGEQGKQGEPGSEPNQSKFFLCVLSQSIKLILH